MFWKSEPERGTDMQQASAHSAREGCSFLQVWLSPDSSIPSFWGTRRTLVLTKACREVSYWTQDCFLIPDTLTILVNRAPIQLPAWTFFFFCRILAGLNFQSECTDAKESFFFFSSCPPPPPHLILPLSVHVESTMHEAKVTVGHPLNLFLKKEWPYGEYSPHLLFLLAL